MASFDLAYAFLLPNEGGYTNNPHDRGGSTNYGITQATLDEYLAAHPGCGLPRDVISLTPLLAGVIYKAWWWRFDGLQSQRVANKVFDMAVNMGGPFLNAGTPNTAIKLLQEAIGASDGPTLIHDAIYGPMTEAAANSVDEARLLAALVQVSLSRYQAIIAARPDQRLFWDGWKARAERLPS